MRFEVRVRPGEPLELAVYVEGPEDLVYIKMAKSVIKLARAVIKQVKGEDGSWHAIMALREAVEAARYAERIGSGSSRLRATRRRR